jgi:hypothetical protein
MRNVVRNMYIKFLRNLIKSEIQKQRLKINFVGYISLLQIVFSEKHVFRQQAKIVVDLPSSGLEYCACPQAL